MKDSINPNSLPTKENLLNKAIVEIDYQHKSITTNTLKTAEIFNKEHKNVLQRTSNLIKIGRLKVKPSFYLNKQNKPQKYYELDRKNFSIVVLGFTGEDAEAFRIKYIEQFEKNIAELIKWEKVRQAVIEPTKLANDSIEWLKKELRKQIPESSKPDRLYTHIQQAINKAATGNARTKRNAMTSNQLKMIEWLESRTKEEIERMKALDISAVEIRQSLLHTLKS